ncbi:MULTISPECIES: metal-sensing transcriptional repressor [Bacillus]|uniref:Uncharacterized protein n=1 Tax=Bacillus capparidis TaxID=1840411 RepID=A0ABS4CWX0_9BACI|nr:MULTISPECIES: metal-sensing transcriptional repressor [Bacillus]MBP1082054.1 hypothetical protein [Bacillus capparidis]MED1096682.1 metal-sensing transcriptional repressor [Bacillus capparidis]
MSVNLESIDHMIEIDQCCSSDGERKSHHSDKVKNNLVTRLNRIEGQIRGIKGLIEKDTYCDDVYLYHKCKTSKQKRKAPNPFLIFIDLKDIKDHTFSPNMYDPYLLFTQNKF